MTREEFETIVVEAVDDLPEKFARALDNVGIVIEDWPSPDDLSSVNAHPGVTLFGLYRGIPIPQRGSNYSALPDKIAIFAGPILDFFPDPEDAKKQIRSTVLHEIGHHFGMNEEEIRRAESERNS
jgi:predicted Zn-dependent protease with MMP-like domain